jgi:hypothetical protein
MEPLEDTEGEPEDEAASRDTGGLRRFTLVILVILVLVFLISLAGFSSTPDDGDWREGGSTEWTEDRTPADYYYLVLPDWWAADIANGRIGSLGVGNASTVDINGEDADSQLVLDHEMGHVTYWEFWDEEVDVSVDARTGQIVMYYKYTETYEGTVTREEIREMAIRVADHWGGIPLDAEGPFIEYDWWSAVNDQKIYEWFVYWYREKDGIQTTDHIRMSFSLDGTLHFYYRDWNMDLGGLDTRYTVPRDEALAIAREIAGDEAPLASCEKRIVRPKDMMMGEEFLWGTRPCCVWAVEYDYNDDTYVACVHVHARTGEVVDGDWYC